jgi:hypothetical protein
MPASGDSCSHQQLALPAMAPQERPAPQRGHAVLAGAAGDGLNYFLAGFFLTAGAFTGWCGRVLP